jgi:hypothetical protein
MILGEIRVLAWMAFGPNAAENERPIGNFDFGGGEYLHTPVPISENVGRDS